MWLPAVCRQLPALIHVRRARFRRFNESKWWLKIRRRHFTTLETQETQPPLRSFAKVAVGVEATNDRLQSLFDTNMLTEAHQLWEHMRAIGPHPDARTFTIVLKNWCKLGRIAMAERLLQAMKDTQDPPPNASHYGLLITHWAYVGNFKEIELLINDMMSIGLKPTPHIWSSSLVAYIKSELTIRERPKNPEDLLPVLNQAKHIFNELVEQKTVYSNAYEAMIELLATMRRFPEAIQQYVFSFCALNDLFLRFRFFRAVIATSRRPDWCHRSTP